MPLVFLHVAVPDDVFQVLTCKGFREACKHDMNRIPATRNA